ncbi:endonuclease/exonuclease/phosphatase family protein [Vibrio fluvialis]|uniref:endonuclease/exonuclease/phosphatase family protein n=1 Tax=Vibrio fluvialis TaxID=676 RepID=UPI001F465959|nr:endonuclease/exonuclease/phosphatase family protein [Vibrio fluvialis]MCE7616386.1 endonuclease/exonuclease/phosphatase family protein [Vibrio fluvialis]
MSKKVGLWLFIMLFALFYWGVQAQQKIWWGENLAAYPPLFILPFVILLLVGLYQKAWLAVFACIFFIAYLVLAAPHDSAVVNRECHRPVRIFQYNMLFSNQHVDQLIAYLSKEQPDLVVLQEVTVNHFEQLQSLDERYPYRFGGQPKVGLPSHQLIFSQQHLYGMHAYYYEGYHNFIRGIWQLDANHPVSLLIAHPPSPRNNKLWQRRNALIQALEYQTTQSPTEDILVIGDMNLSGQSARFHTLFRQMQTVPIASWPNHPKFALPAWLKISIDHLWLNSELSICKRETVQELNGSDHNAIMTYVSR